MARPRSTVARSFPTKGPARPGAYVYKQSAHVRTQAHTHHSGYKAMYSPDNLLQGLLGGLQGGILVLDVGSKLLANCGAVDGRGLDGVESIGLGLLLDIGVGGAG